MTSNRGDRQICLSKGKSVIHLVHYIIFDISKEGRTFNGVVMQIS